MNQLVRCAVAIAVVAVGISARQARAQPACDTLPNPIVVSGSTDFEPTLQQFAVRLADESAPATIVSIAALGQGASCAAVKGIVEGTDFGGLPGRYYTRNGTTIVANTCTFLAGRTADVAISDVFYETCANVPQPKPADVTDTLGPVQAAVFVVPKADITTRYLTYEEAQAIYGCGVSATRKVADTFNNPPGIFCQDATAGMQNIVALSLGLPDTASMTRNCVRKANNARLIADLSHRLTRSEGGMCDPTMGDVCDPPPAALGFVNAAAFDDSGGAINSIAFRALGQSLAFYPDSGPVPDRRNVRDGHYPLWGYVHMIAKTGGGGLNPQASELIAWINGIKTSPKIDSFALETGGRYIPQCAMKVRRSSDGGLLSPYAPPQPCNCAAEALLSRANPAGCTPCTSASVCGCGQTCRHGFCE